MHMLPVWCVQSGIVLAVAGIGWTAGLALRGRPRRRGTTTAVCGFVLVAAGFALPARDIREPQLRTRLDEFVPVYQFNEVHRVRVAAPPERVFAAVEAVTSEEILLFRTLVWLRRFGRAGPESILNVPGRTPVIEVATRTTFLRLAGDPPRELVVGTIVVAPAGMRPALTPDAFRRLDDPGFAKAAMNFLVEPDGAGGAWVTTETRVAATDAASRRRFAAYWRVIYPGSALIRRMWLRAIRNRAEAAGAPGGYSRNGHTEPSAGRSFTAFSSAASSVRSLSTYAKRKP